MGERVPVDDYGMPFLLHPYEAPAHETQRWDDDHSFFFSSSPELMGQAGAALRYSRVQHVPRWLHDRKHNIHYPEGLEWLPDNVQDKFALTILACAGYVSPFAIDVRGTSPQLVRMSRVTYDFVKGRRQLYPEMRRDQNLGFRTQAHAKRRIGIFIAEYVKDQDISDVSEEVIDQFLHAPGQKTRRRMGNVILGKAIEVAVDPIRPIYQRALGEELLRPVESHPMRVVTQLFPQQRWSDYHCALEQRLAA